MNEKHVKPQDPTVISVRQQGHDTIRSVQFGPEGKPFDVLKLAVMREVVEVVDPAAEQILAAVPEVLQPLAEAV